MNYLKEKIRTFTDKSTLEKTIIIVPYAIVMLISVRACELYRLCKSNIFTFIKEKKRWYIKGDTDIDKFTPFLDIETPKPKKAKDKGR